MLVNIISSSKGGGAEFLVHELHKAYVKRGIESRTVYLSGGSDGLVENERVLGVNPRSPWNIIRIRKLIKLFRAESNQSLTVHVHLTWPFFYVALASLGLRGIKLIYTEHNTTNKRRKIPLFWIFERLIYSRYLKIICISSGVHLSLAQWIGPHLSSRLVTIYNGSRVYEYADRTSRIGTKPRLISVGSLTIKKNFSTAILSVAQIQSEIESYTIVGEGPERGRLEKIIRQNGLEKVVHLIGWSDALEEKFHASDIQVVPSIWEGFGLVAVEGMSTGLPVVASNVDGLREVLGTKNLAATLVDDPENVDSWQRGLKLAIKKLRRDGCQSLGAAARRQAEKFSLDVMVDRYIDVYLGV